MAFIETERLILRTWMPGDAARLLELSSDAEVVRFLPIPAKLSLELIREYIERQMDEEEREGFSVWPVVRKEDGRLIGRCGFHRMSEGWIEIAWIFEREAWGHGYATEAATAVLRYGRDILRLHPVCALIHPGNSRSIRVAQRLGLRFDRVVRAYKRDLMRYST